MENKIITINDAILELNPNATFEINEEQLYENITWDEVNHSGIKPLKADVEAKIIEMQTAEDNKETAKTTAKASGNTKLLGLGLTQAEATALTGYTPE